MMSVEIAPDTDDRRRAWLASACALGAHLNDCFPCLVEWATDCGEGQRLRAASDAAWTRYAEDQR